MTNREAKKAEALKRMKALGLMSKIIKEFQEHDTLYYSERTALGGILYWVSNEPEWEKLIREFEEERDALVYHATHEELRDVGECLTLLFVSADEETWPYDLEDCNNTVAPYGHAMYAEVFVLGGDNYHEFGTVGMTEKAGGLIRTA